MGELKHSGEKSRIGWIGTGVMGFWMCRHLLETGYSVSVYNRTKSKCDELIKMGAKWAGSPAQAASQSDIIFTILGYPKDVREVYFGVKGVFEGCKGAKGKYLVDMTTTEPSLAVEIFNRAAEAGCHSLDAPVSGGDVGAKEARLTIMAGGERQVFDSLLPVLSHLGKNIRYAGKAGSGQHTKMCNQIAITGIMCGMCESLIYGYKAGLNLSEMVDTIKGGAAASWSLENYGPRILKGDFKPGFMVEHYIKDMGIALEEAKRMNINLPGLTLVHQLYSALNAMGHGKKGTHSLVLALDRLSSAGFPESGL